MLDCLLVGLGGFVGTVCRYLVGLLPLKTAGGFPVKTLAINIVGAFVISLIAALAARRALNPRLVLMLRVGVCGGFTTFSTFAYETVELLQKGSVCAALSYMLASVALSVLAVFAAQLLVR
ncbi:MAG: fluoride efflux transporter CrcB [Clostridia bacterium]